MPQIALINNMPDAALEGTENQFLDLLAAAARNSRVRGALFAARDYPRRTGSATHERFVLQYLRPYNGRFDAVIITGTEPLQQICGTKRIGKHWWTILDWAEHSTASTILSCLAAHASVLHSDGVARHPLSDKSSASSTQKAAAPPSYGGRSRRYTDSAFSLE